MFRDSRYLAFVCASRECDRLSSWKKKHTAFLQRIIALEVFGHLPFFSTISFPSPVPPCSSRLALCLKRQESSPPTSLQEIDVV